MSSRMCSIEDCGKSPHARGWCSAHYLRWYNHGDPLAGGVQRLDKSSAFDAYTSPDGECIMWTGGTDRAGYGKFRSQRAHRYAWERANGPIPDGMYIDHKCYRPGCVNPEHLRLATPEQNTWNKSGAATGRKVDLPRGVTPYKKTGFVAKVGGDHIGIYLTPEAASEAAGAERARRYGEFAGRG